MWKATTSCQNSFTAPWQDLTSFGNAKSWKNNPPKDIPLFGI